MCGIAGHLLRDAAAAAQPVEGQLRLLDHRGPDSSGVFVRGAGAIGQTRLRIIDLVTGDPPLTDESGDIGAVLNGEIYGYRAIRDELAARGHTLRTTGDTEVLAHLTEELDPVDVARRIDGMFAFATWDARRGRLVIGRDRLGKKPLYWWSDGAAFVFASEIKALLADPRVPRRQDPAALDAYLRFGYVPTPGTWFEGVRSVPPGHVVIVEHADLAVRIEPYWTLPHRGLDLSSLDVGIDEAATLVRRELERAVEARLVSDVPLGAFLSGGIDSATIVGIMAGLTSEPVRTFTIGFDDRDGFDEREPARLIANRFGTDHTELVVHPDAVDLVERLVWYHDQPFGDSSAVPTWLLSEMTREHVTVALCGDGGDELFAGYERFTAGLYVDRWRLVPSPLRALVRSVSPRLPARFRRFAANADRGLPDAYREWVAYLDDADIDRLLPGASRRSIDDYDAIWKATRGAATLDRLLDLNLRTYLLDDLLPKVDRTSMAHALEVRAPFLDHRLVELAVRLPPATKARGLQRKRVLRRAVADLLPAEILDRPKRGFGVPLDRWFRDELGDHVRSMLGSPSSRVRAQLEGDAVDDILDEHASGRRDHGHALWTLLTLEVFFRQQDW